MPSPSAALLPPDLPVLHAGAVTDESLWRVLVGLELLRFTEIADGESRTQTDLNDVFDGAVRDEDMDSLAFRLAQDLDHLTGTASRRTQPHLPEQTRASGRRLLREVQDRLAERSVDGGLLVRLALMVDFVLTESESS